MRGAKGIYDAKCHSFSIEKPPTYLLKGRMAEKGVTSLLTHRRRMQPNATGMQTKKAGCPWVTPGLAVGKDEGITDLAAASRPGRNWHAPGIGP